MSWLSKQCGRWRRNISLRECGALSRQEQRELEDHLASCAACTEFLNELKTVGRSLTQWKQSVAKIEPAPAAKARWAMAIRAVIKPSLNHESGLRKFFSELWYELVLPCRGRLAGVAAACLVMWGINSGMFNSQGRLALPQAPVPSVTWQNLREQKQLLAELMQGRETTPPEPAGKRRTSPRSEIPILQITS